MIGLKNVEVSLSPFLKLNDNFVFYNKYSGRSILLKGLSSPKKRKLLINTWRRCFPKRKELYS